MSTNRISKAAPLGNCDCHVDHRLEALRQVFSVSSHEVEAEGALGDYRVTITDQCLSEEDRQAVERMGFEFKSTHAHVKTQDGEEVAQIVAYIEDTREGGR